MPRARPKPHVEIKPYVPGQALDPPTPITAPPEPIDQSGDPNAQPEHDDAPDDDGFVSAADPALLDPTPPQMPGFSMSDQPFDPAPSFAEHVTGGGEEVFARPAAAVPLTGDLVTPADQEAERRPPPNAVRYESRISIVEAWRYPGNLTGAPDWIDRNWIGFGDYDDVRKIEPGPCLRVPVYGDPYAVALCRLGDYMARQEVKITPDLPGEIRIQVWEAEQFQRLFIPRLD